MRMRELVAGAAVALMLGGCTAAAPSSSVDDAVTDGRSLSPAGNEVYACLTEKGWDVTLTWDGGIETTSESMPASQADQYDADSRACWDMIDERISAMQPADIVKVYQRELATRACLLDHGYEVEEPPSEQQYVDDFFGARWSAYGASNASGRPLPGDDWRTINEACPQPAWSLGTS